MNHKEQYIKKSEVVAEIEKRIEAHKETLKNCDSSISEMVLKGSMSAYQSLFHFLDTLETKEEILDKEGKTKLMKKCVHKAYKRGYDMGVLKTTNEMNHNMK